MGKLVLKPEKYCPICGQKPSLNHRCNIKTLEGIDNAHRRTEFSQPPPNFTTRLAHGAFLHSLADDEQEND